MRKLTPIEEKIEELLKEIDTITLKCGEHQLTNRGEHDDKYHGFIREINIREYCIRELQYIIPKEESAINVSIVKEKIAKKCA